MLISYRWLARHIDLSGLSPERVAEDWTLSTAEVESLRPWAAHLGDVVVGHVLAREPHPNADKLGVCAVDLGDGAPLSIVCGAANVAAGQRVAVARVGTVLPGDLKLKKSKIRGVESEGMICSERELGLGDEHDGIWVLPADAAVGLPVSAALDCADWVFEIDNKSLTHRPDLWGHRGLAGEIAAIHGRALVPLELELERGAGAPAVVVSIESPACSRYVAVALDGVANGPSPGWLKRLLLAVGQRPIDRLVDVSNFVMLDLGQPNHLFDRRVLGGEGVRVREARQGETLRTLDGVQRTLAPGDLLITAGDEPVALAGIMGGERTKVGGDSSALLLEVASFDPVRVRRTSARLGLRTDSSARFEKSLDPTLPPKAAAHLVNVLRELEPGLVVRSVSDAGDWKDPARELRLRPARVRALLGIDATDAQITEILARLGFGLAAEGDVLRVRVPSARATKDVTIEQDLIEEVGRIWRYDNVPERVLTGALAPPRPGPRAALARRLCERLAGAARFREIIGYSFQSDALLARLGLAEAPHVRVLNPAAEGLSAVRRSVAPSLLAGLAANLRHAERVRVFELGKGYRPETRNEQGEPREVHELALVWAAPRPARGARFDAGALAQLRGVVDDLLAAANLADPLWESIPEAQREPWLHPKRALLLRLPAADPNAGELTAGFLGELEPGVAEGLGIAADVAVASLSIDLLLEAAARPSDYRPIPRFPSTKLDVALALPAELAAEQAAGAIRSAGKGLVRALELFDVYSGPNLGPGRKSLAWHVELAADDRTLEDKDTHKFLSRLERLAADLGGELRRE